MLLGALLGGFENAHGLEGFFQVADVAYQRCDRAMELDQHLLANR